MKIDNFRMDLSRFIRMFVCKIDLFRSRRYKNNSIISKEKWLHKMGKYGMLNKRLYRQSVTRW